MRVSAGDGSDLHSVYVGTYQRSGPSLFHLRFDARTETLRVQSAVSSVPAPSFFALHPTGRYLYACSEADGPEGELHAFAVDERTGDLAPLGRRRAHGTSTCHVAVDATGRFAVVANYGSPTIALFPVRGDGALEEACAVVRHEGRSVHPRQGEPHPHSVHFDPGNRFVYCPDLGIDRVKIYRFDAARGSLEPNDPPELATAPGAGPRHFDFHPDGRHAYAVNEIDSTVLACAWDGETGALTSLHTLSALPEGFHGDSWCADIHVHPSGRFLYASNRGHDSIAVFTVDGSSGRLTPAGHASTEGRTPRNFALDPSGRHLFAENQDSGDIVTFAVDEETGALRDTGQRLEIPTPVCMRFGRAWD